jgi:hypothetical protein
LFDRAAFFPGITSVAEPSAGYYPDLPRATEVGGDLRGWMVVLHAGFG